MHFGVKGWRWRLRGCCLRLRGRGAKAGSILGINTPPPTFWRTQKMQVREGG